MNVNGVDGTERRELTTYREGRLPQVRPHVQESVLRGAAAGADADPHRAPAFRARERRDQMMACEACVWRGEGLHSGLRTRFRGAPGGGAVGVWSNAVDASFLTWVFSLGLSCCASYR